MRNVLGVVALVGLLVVGVGGSVAQVPQLDKVIEFQGLTAFVVDDTTPNKLDVRVILVNAEKTESPHKTTHVPWLAIHPKHIVHSPYPDARVGGWYVWNLNGKEVHIESSASPSGVTFSSDAEKSIVKLGSLTIFGGDKQPGAASSAVWEDEPEVVAARVRLPKIGEICVDADSVSSCGFKVGDSETACNYAGSGSVDVANVVRHKTNFDTIYLSNLGDTRTPGPQITVKSSAVVKIRNLPIWVADSNQLHFRQFYDLTDNASAWKDRCRFGTCAEPLSDSAFCPPVRLLRRANP